VNLVFSAAAVESGLQVSSGRSIFPDPPRPCRRAPELVQCVMFAVRKED
jgi:hypothetical protein